MMPIISPPPDASAVTFFATARAFLLMAPFLREARGTLVPAQRAGRGRQLAPLYIISFTITRCGVGAQAVLLGRR